MSRTLKDTPKGKEERGWIKERIGKKIKMDLREHRRTYKLFEFPNGGYYNKLLADNWNHT